MKFKIETENTELKKIQFQTCKNSSSRTVKFTGQELENLQGIYTNNIYTNNNNTKSINIKSDDEFFRIKNKTSNIKNLPRYLAICLYNLLGNIRNLNIKSKFEFEREYPPEFFDTMYVN